MKSLCKGRIYNKEFPNKFNTTRGTESYFDQTALKPDAIAFPCGYLAASFPGDRFQELEDAGGKKIKIVVDSKLNLEGSEVDGWKDGATKI